MRLMPAGAAVGWWVEVGMRVSRTATATRVAPAPVAPVSSGGNAEDGDAPIPVDDRNPRSEHPDLTELSPRSEVDDDVADTEPPRRLGDRGPIGAVEDRVVQTFAFDDLSVELPRNGGLDPTRRLDRNRRRIPVRAAEHRAPFSERALETARRHTAW